MRSKFYFVEGVLFVSILISTLVGCGAKKDHVLITVVPPQASKNNIGKSFLQSPGESSFQLWSGNNSTLTRTPCQQSQLMTTGIIQNSYAAGTEQFQGLINPLRSTVTTSLPDYAATSPSPIPTSSLADIAADLNFPGSFSFTPSSFLVPIGNAVEIGMIGALQLGKPINAGSTACSTIIPSGNLDQTHRVFFLGSIKNITPSTNLSVTIPVTLFPVVTTVTLTATPNPPPGPDVISVGQISDSNRPARDTVLTWLKFDTTTLGIALNDAIFVALDYIGQSNSSANSIRLNLINNLSYNLSSSFFPDQFLSGTITDIKTAVMIPHIFPFSLNAYIKDVPNNVHKKCIIGPITEPNAADTNQNISTGNAASRFYSVRQLGFETNNNAQSLLLYRPLPSDWTCVAVPAAQVP